MRNYLGSSWTATRAVWRVISEKQLGLIAAGVAFFGMFGLFPGIAALISIFGLVSDPVVVMEQLELLEGVIPSDAYQLFAGQMLRLLQARSDTLGVTTFVSIAVALWSSRAGIAALMGGLNAISGAPSRNGLWQAVVALGLTVCLVLLAAVAVLAVVVAPVALALLPIAVETASLLEALRWVVVLVTLLLALGLLYRFGPSPQAERGRWFTVGAAVVIILWLGASMGLSYYLSNFASYNEVYGSIGAVIGLLLWLYVSAYLVLFGAVLNSQIHRKSVLYSASAQE